MTKIQTVNIHGDIVKNSLVIVEAGPGSGFLVEGMDERSKTETLLRGLTALQSKGYIMPDERVRITFWPVREPKSGSGFDLAVAVGLLVELGMCPAPKGRVVFYGALGLGGEVIPAERSREKEAEKARMVLNEGDKLVHCHSKLGKKNKNSGHICVGDLGEVIDMLRAGEL